VGWTNIPNSANARILGIEVWLLGNNATNAQAGQLRMSICAAGGAALAADIPNGAGSIAEAHRITFSGASEDSTAAKTFDIKVTHDAANANQSFTLNLGVLELV
jgi:hypothetical protein